MSTDDDCMIWSGRYSKNGYPLVDVTVRHGGYRHKSGSRWRSARQVIYAEQYGATGGLPVTTTCGRSGCVQPAHLALVRALTTHCANGHKYTASTTRWRVRHDKGETTPTRDCLICKHVSEGRRRRKRISERSYC